MNEESSHDDEVVYSNVLSTRNMTQWTPHIEKIVKNIGEKSQGYKVIHILEARTNNFMCNIFMHISICIGPVAGLFSALNTIHSDKIFAVIATFLSILSGIFMAIIKFGKFEEKGAMHKLASSKYSSLEDNIRKQLSYPRTYRISSKDFLNWISHSYDEIFTSSPLVSKKNYDKYTIEAKKRGLVLPDEYGELIMIDENEQNLSGIPLSTKPKHRSILSEPVMSSNLMERSYSKNKDIKMDIIPKSFDNNLIKEKNTEIKRSPKISSSSLQIKRSPLLSPVTFHIKEKEENIQLEDTKLNIHIDDEIKNQDLKKSPNISSRNLQIKRLPLLSSDTFHIKEKEENTQLEDIKLNIHIDDEKKNKVFTFNKQLNINTNIVNDNIDIITTPKTCKRSTEFIYSNMNEYNDKRMLYEIKRMKNK